MTTREKVLAHLQSHHYRPIKLRRLSRFFDVADEEYGAFKALVRQMLRDGDIASAVGWYARNGRVHPPWQVDGGSESPGHHFF